MASRLRLRLRLLVFSFVVFVMLSAVALFAQNTSAPGTPAQRPEVSAAHPLTANAADRPALPPVLARRVLLSPATDVFPEIVRAAGTIFAGRVTNIVRSPASDAHSVETVAITFHVENAIRGAVTGTDFTITQWMGLWTSGQRYRNGEHLLVFLYPPSKLGLTSCVAGSLGRFGVDAQGRVVLSEQHSAAFANDPLLAGKARMALSDFEQAVKQQK